MAPRNSSSITLPQTLVFAICIGALGWLFTTVQSTYGDHNVIQAMQSRIGSLEVAARNCSHGGS